jgi:DNA-binding response OmpR family regulator
MSKILYVEDEPFLAKIVKESLESRGYAIHHLSDGEKILAECQQQNPDLIILDIMLPYKDGYTLATEIRNSGFKTPIIFLTAKEQPDDVVQGFKTGGNDYIKKPFSMEELILRIENLLSLTQNQHILPDKIKIGQYLYDSMIMNLSIGEKEIRLSHRENEIIKKLYQSRNSRLERKEILMDIWGDDSFFNSRNLDVYIRKIRTYFKDDPDIKIITLKGVGYHFYIDK